MRTDRAIQYFINVTGFNSFFSILQELFDNGLLIRIAVLMVKSQWETLF